MTSEGIMILFILAVILLGVSLFYKDRKVSVIVIENLPPWIFKKDEREDYSKNCELKSVSEYNYTDDISIEGHSNTQEEVLNDNEKSHKEKESLKEETLVSKDAEEYVNDLEKVENTDICNSMEKDSQKYLENVHKEAHKPKFITNSMTMLKDYEKLLDKFEERESFINEEKGFSQEKNSHKKTIEIPKENKISKKEEKVYWTNSGRTYHRKRSCTALARSKIIHKGTIEESKKLFACSKCK